jgi:hypothetical protein
MGEPGKAGRTPDHYAIGQWIDFVRGVTPDREAARMTNHAARCSGCRNCMNFWMKLTATARSMAQPRPRTTSGR